MMHALAIGRSYRHSRCFHNKIHQVLNSLAGLIFCDIFSRAGKYLTDLTRHSLLSSTIARVDRIRDAIEHRKSQAGEPDLEVVATQIHACATDRSNWHFDERRQARCADPSVHQSPGQSLDRGWIVAGRRCSSLHTSLHAPHRSQTLHTHTVLRHPTHTWRAKP